MLRPYAGPVDPARHQRSPARPAPQAFRPDGAQIGPVPLFATKPIATLRAEAEATGEHALVRALGPLNLVTLGIGAVIGAGDLRDHGAGGRAVRRSRGAALDDPGRRRLRIRRAMLR